MTKEEIARSAATVWCNCHKCDGIVNDTGSKCTKPNVTCHKWYDGYRAAKIALDKAVLYALAEQLGCFDEDEDDD